MCPYRGPAIVFESNWDLAGALGVHSGDHSLRADVITHRLKVDNRGISTFLYGRADYQYSDNMFVYRFDHNLA